MIFRRSLVREMTVTAVGLFLVLLGILFTNLVLRLLARAAGGTSRRRASSRCSGFNALFYFNILLSVTVFVTVLLTLSRWYRDSEMIVWFTSGIGLDRLPAADPLVRGARSSSRSSCCRCFCRPGPSSASSNTSASSNRATKSRCSRRASFREFRRANLVVFVESINTLRRHDPQRLPALGRGRQGRDDGRALGYAAGRAQRRPLHRAGRRPPLRRQARHRRIPDRRIRQARAPDRAGGAARAARPRPRRSRPPLLLALDGPLERAELFWRLSVPIASLVLTLLAVPLAYVNPRIGTLVQPDRRGVPLHALQQLPQHRAELHRAGQARIPARARASARDRDRRSCCSSSAISCRCSALFSRWQTGEGRRRDEDAHALHRPRGARARSC